MRSRNHCHSFSLRESGAKAFMSSESFPRKASLVIWSKEKPMTANCSDSSPSRARLVSAGRSLRLVRSPLAPKMIMTHGDALWGTSRSFRFAILAFRRPRPVRSAHRLLLFFHVPAKLEAHGGKDLAGEVVLAARGEALVQRSAQHRRRGGGLDGRKKRPAALAGVRNPARKALQRGLLQQGNGGKVEKPRSDDAPAPPHLSHVGQ